jgi:hypothetical protein
LARRRIGGYKDEGYERNAAVLAILLLVFVLANPRPLVAAYLALAPDRYREQAASYSRTDAAPNDCMVAGCRDQRRYHAVSIGSLLWLKPWVSVVAGVLPAKSKSLQPIGLPLQLTKLSPNFFKIFFTQSAHERHCDLICGFEHKHRKEKSDDVNQDIYCFGAPTTLAFQPTGDWLE